MRFVSRNESSVRGEAAGQALLPRQALVVRSIHVDGLHGGKEFACCSSRCGVRHDVGGVHVAGEEALRDLLGGIVDARRSAFVLTDAQRSGPGVQLVVRGRKAK